MAEKRKVENIYIQGNTVRKMEAVPVRKIPVRPEQPIRRHPQKKQTQSSPKAFLFLFVVAVSLTFFVCVAYLSCQAQNKVMVSEIKSLEKEVEKVSSINDSTEYYIYSNFNFNNAIEVATKEMGMVQLTQSNIEYYDSPQDEYINQYRDIPK